jgi:hypothetical protein
LRGYQAVRIGLDLLRGATPEDVHELTGARGWDELAAPEIYAAEHNLDATYIIRVYSVFERAVSSFWRDIPGNEELTVDGDELLVEVGVVRLIDEDVIRFAQEVRAHRNKLVHGRLDEHAAGMTLENATRDLLTYLARLPATWG